MKMKKFINAPETITDEELTGLGLAYPDILDVDGHLVISKDLADADRVTIVTYGGSGHEPAQAGFVGKGMLDVQAVGDIFAAPNGQLVFDAMKLADKGHGVLLLTLNYAGDQLAGKQAMKLAKKAGLNVRQVVTGEEIQYDPNGEDNKRGLAGAIALYHIAAAAAREGKTLDEVAEIAQHYADNMASITVKCTNRAILTPLTVLLGVSQSALHVSYYRSRRERSARHGVYLLRQRLVHRLVLPVVEQLLRAVEEVGRLGVGFSLNSRHPAVLYMYLQRHRSAVSLHVLCQRLCVHHERSVGRHLQRVVLQRLRLMRLSQVVS